MSRVDENGVPSPVMSCSARRRASLGGAARAATCLAAGLVGALGCARREPGQPPAPAGRAEVPAQPAPTPESPCAPALFCDDFEDDETGVAPGSPWRDETKGSGATVRVDSARAHSGQRSVHVFAPRGASYRRGYFAIHEPPVFPSAGGEMYGRLMLWLEAAPVTPAGAPAVHWTLLQGEGRSADDRYNAIYRYGGQHQGGLGLMANYETTPPVRSDCWQHSAARLPVSEWACVEWHFVAATNEMELWLDGASVSDVHVTERATAPGAGCLHAGDLGGRWLAPPAFQSLYLGYERYQEPDNDQHLWIDDVVVSRSRVGCPE